MWKGWDGLRSERSIRLDVLDQASDACSLPSSI